MLNRGVWHVVRFPSLIRAITPKNVNSEILWGFILQGIFKDKKHTANSALKHPLNLKHLKTLPQKGWLQGKICSLASGKYFFSTSSLCVSPSEPSCWTFLGKSEPPRAVAQCSTPNKWLENQVLLFRRSSYGSMDYGHCVFLHAHVARRE